MGKLAPVFGRALRMGVICTAGVLVIYLVAVWTVPGQRFEDAVLRAADRVAGSAEQARALDILGPIGQTTVLVAVTIVFLIAAVRRQPFVGAVAVGVIAASIIIAEGIQHFAERPILLAHGYRREDQSFPSGHTTVAMSVMCALVMVTPYRHRGMAVLLTSVGAAGVGLATVTASWHRPSDTIGADLIAVGCACAGVAVLAVCGRVREATPPSPVERLLRRLLAGAYAVGGAVALAVAVVLVLVALDASGAHPSDPHPSDPHSGGADMLVAGGSLALAGSAAVALALLALLRHVDLGAPPADRTEEGIPDVEPRSVGVDRPAGP
jgi:membrane-associated phospholipid phosphatase